MMKKMGALFLAGMLSQWAMADAASVQSQLHKNYPSLKIENIKTTEMPGIYSGSVGDQIIYTGEGAEHILVGSMIRLKDQKNLTNTLMLSQNRKPSARRKPHRRLLAPGLKNASSSRLTKHWLTAPAGQPNRPPAGRRRRPPVPAKRARPTGKTKQLPPLAKTRSSSTR